MRTPLCFIVTFHMPLITDAGNRLLDFQTDSPKRCSTVNSIMLDQISYQVYWSQHERRRKSICNVRALRKVRTLTSYLNDRIYLGIIYQVRVVQHWACVCDRSFHFRNATSWLLLLSCAYPPNEAWPETSYRLFGTFQHPAQPTVRFGSDAISSHLCLSSETERPSRSIWFWHTRLFVRDSTGWISTEADQKIARRLV